MMLPVEFELYAHRFRWVDAECAAATAGMETIALIRMREPFAADAVQWLSPSNGRVPSYGAIGSTSVYRFEGVADFAFPPNGGFVQIWPHPDADYAALEFTLYRGVLPRILHLRGATCLHASAVAVSGGVVAFCGPSGAGKSTLSAALVSRGLALVSDDVLPLRCASSGSLLAGPGLPELRLHPATAELIGVNHRMTPPLPGETKAHWQPRRAPDTPLPLLGVYLLEPSLRGSSEQLASTAPLPPPQALLGLLSNSFWVHPQQTGALATDLLRVGELLRSVPVCRLAFELSEAGLDAVYGLVLSSVRLAA
jgi:hypothetical protein